MRSPTAELLLFCACDDGSVADVDDVADPLEQDEDFAADVAKLAESESKQQTAEYTWSQTADEVTFEMPFSGDAHSSLLTATTDGHKLVVLWDRGSLFVELYAPISASKIGPAKMRCGTLLLTMRKMRAAETWPSFECDGLGPRRTPPPPSQRMRKVRRMCAKQSAVLGIADAIGAGGIAGSVAPRSHEFTAATCARLGVAAPPEWLNALAQTAASGASAFGMMRSPSSPRPTERTDLLSVEI